MPNKLSEKDLEKIVKEIVKFFDSKAKVEVKTGDQVEINIDSEDSGQLIGRFGQTLQALQHVVRLVVNHAAGEQVSLSLDVQNYKSNKVKELEELALSMADNVAKSGYAQSLRPMNAFERRVVHTALNGFEGVEVSSQGEEPMRFIEIKPKA